MRRLSSSKGDWIGYVIAAAALFVAGLIAGAVILSWLFYVGFTLKMGADVNFDIDPLALVATLLSDAVSIFLAIYIVRNLSKKDEADRVERKLLIDRFTRFDEELLEKTRRFSAGGCSITTIAGNIKRFTMRVQELCKLGAEHSLLKEDNPATLAVFDKMRELNVLLTSTPKTGDIEDGIRIVEEKLHYSTAQTDKIAQCMSDISSAIFRVVVEINRAN